MFFLGQPVEADNLDIMIKNIPTQPHIIHLGRVRITAFSGVEPSLMDKNNCKEAEMKIFGAFK